MDFTLFQVKMFLTVAETLSFSKASEELYLEQSTLSRRINMLEQELGFALFDRKSRPVRLTYKGEKLYEHWKPLYEAFEHSLSMISSMNDTAKTLTICMVDSGIQLNDVPAVSREMQELYPDISLSFRFSPMSQWLSQLERHLCDVAVTILFDTVDVGPEYRISEIVTVPKLVCMLQENPLSRKRSICFEDLREQHFISIADTESPRHAEFIRKICRQHGFEPNIDRRTPNAHGLTAMLQHNNEVLVCDRFLRGYNNPMFKIFELPDTLSGLYAVYAKDSANPFLEPFLQVLRSFYNHI